MVAEGTLVVWDRFGGDWLAVAAPGDNMIRLTNIQPEPGRQMSLEHRELAFWFEPNDVGKLLALSSLSPTRVITPDGRHRHAR